MATATAVAMMVGLTVTPASGAPRPDPDSAPVVEPTLTAPHRTDNLEHPLGVAQQAARKEAIARLVAGKAKPEKRNGSEVVGLGRGRWVEYKKKQTKVDPIFTLLVEFGDQRLPTTGGGAGPVHNQIPEPDRVYDGSATDDNSTLWRADFSREYYEDLLFAKDKESMTHFYYQQSAGRYTVGGDVSDWVRVPYNEARYGSNAISQADGYWNFVKDSAAAWYDAQIAAGQTPDQIRAYLAQFDLWDRYDYDGDGDFNEPDGYLDHFQAIHAGQGEEAGGGAEGTDAIWSHRWYAFSNLSGSAGPAGNLAGGVPIGDSGIWIGDYTTEPENGGLGVFAHEFGHDLGLPDLYDTNSGENGTGFWSIMSAGSWLSHGKQDIGSTPNFQGAWEKLFLGWLDFEVVRQGQSKTVTLGPAGRGGGPHPQAVVVNLPDVTTITDYNTPYSGQYEWWGGSADDLNTTLTRAIDLTGATSAQLTAKVWYDIEEDYDFLYGEVSTNGGTSWAAVADGLDGSSGGAWTDLSYDLSAYAGQSVLFRFRYQTDGGVHHAGPFLDDIALVVNGTTAWSDDVEAGEGGWTARGFTRFTGTATKTTPRFYLAENRSYVGYDVTLREGPYNFGWADTKPNFVERFPYQDGLLVWYVNYAYDDNNTSVHPGFGQALPVDARPAPIVFPDGTLLANRRQPFDATFGRQATDRVTFHRYGAPVTVPSRPAVPVFNDSNPDAYWSAKNPQNSVKVAGNGTQIVVKQENTRTNQVLLKITNP